MKIWMCISAIIVCTGAFFAFYPETSEPPKTQEEDSGMTRSETEAFMREIGYVQ